MVGEGGEPVVEVSSHIRVDLKVKEEGEGEGGVVAVEAVKGEAHPVS